MFYILLNAMIRKFPPLKRRSVWGTNSRREKMKKKASRKSTLQVSSPSSTTPKSIILENRNSKKKPTTTSALRSKPQNSLASISDLKDLASSRFQHLKSDLIDHSHSEIIKDLEAFQSRLHKRFKVFFFSLSLSQSCLVPEKSNG